ADITDATNRTKGMGAAGAANNVGSILGPAVSGLAVLSLLTPLWVMAGVALLNGLFVWRFLPEPPRQRAAVKPKRMKYTDARILPFVIVGVTMFSGMALVQQTLGFRFQDALGLNAGDTAQVFGFAMMISAACSLIAQGVIVQRISVPPFVLLRLAMPLLIIAFTMMALLESQLWLSVAMGVLGFGMGMAGPGFMAGASLAVSPEEQGAVAGVAAPADRWASPLVRWWVVCCINGTPRYRTPSPPAFTSCCRWPCTGLASAWPSTNSRTEIAGYNSNGISCATRCGSLRHTSDVST
ncbi:MAG: MFS transporter, partial [Gammaproteobacteria bacterium]|nr:MFS transporter [Gammaproteobacteria bacterium]